MLQKKHRIHFVGIGGIGMSGIAEVLLNLGYAVSGSDLQDSEATRRLERSRRAGFSSAIRRKISPADPSVVVISTAVKYSNPEVLEARRRHIPVIPRAEMLAELMRMKYGVAVAGSHGKTTTTSMVSAVLSAAGLDPTMVIGGRLHMLGSNAKMGQGEILVAEADESDGSFLLLSPTIAVVTNIDQEHMDYHGTMERLNESFLTFINKVPFYGLAVLCLDDANVRGLLPKVRKRFTTYGLSPEAEFSAEDLKMNPAGVEFTALHHGKSLGQSAPAHRRDAIARPIRWRPSRWPMNWKFRLPMSAQALDGVQRDSSPLRNQRRAQRGHGDRRLRPSSRRDSRHHRRDSRQLEATTDGDLSAPSLHAARAIYSTIS